MTIQLKVKVNGKEKKYWVCGRGNFIYLQRKSGNKPPNALNEMPEGYVIDINEKGLAYVRKK